MGSLRDLISEEDLSSYSSVYFSALGPVGDLIDPRIYAQRCKDYYGTSTSASFAFGAVAARIAALGSFLSSTRHPRESGLAQYVKAILDDLASMRKLNPDLITAWAMRVFYLCATSRLSIAWVALCTMMHLCEAVELHNEEHIRKIAAAAAAASLGHTLLSYEYDRSSVTFRTVTTQAIIAVPGSVADHFVRIAQIILLPDSSFKLASQPRPETEELFERLEALQELELSDPFLLITRADVALCFYRRAYQLKMGIPDDFIHLMITNGNVAVAAAINTPEASAQIPTAFKGWKTLVMAADTPHTREALSTANRLLDLHLDKKQKELAQLEPVQARYQALGADQTSSVPEAVNMSDLIDWDQFFFEPYLSMFGTDVRL